MPRPRPPAEPELLMPTPMPWPKDLPEEAPAGESLPLPDLPPAEPWIPEGDG